MSHEQARNIVHFAQLALKLKVNEASNLLKRVIIASTARSRINPQNCMYASKVGGRLILITIIPILRTLSILF